MAEISSLSTEYLEIPVLFAVNGAAQDPTADVVSLAFTAPGVDPVSGDWKLGSWESGGPPYTARVLVGPNGGSVTLAKGSYDVWIRITDTPENPYRKAGFLRVT